MRIKITFFFTMLISFGNELLGQESNGYFSIGIVPTYFFDPITPSIGIALEKSLYKKINLELTYGYDPNINFLRWQEDPSARHHEYKLVFKYLFTDKNLDELDFYVGIDYFGNYKKYKSKNGFFKENGLSFSYQSADVIRKVNGSRIHFGLKLFNKSNIVFDFFSGVGIRFVNVGYTTNNSIQVSEPLYNKSLFIWDSEVGTRTTFAMTNGIKLAYRF